MDRVPEIVWCERHSTLLRTEFEVIDDDQLLIATLTPDQDLLPTGFTLAPPGGQPWFRLIHNHGWEPGYEMALPNDDLLARLQQNLDGTTLLMGDGAELDVVTRNLGQEVEILDHTGELLAYIARRRGPDRAHLEPHSHRVSFAPATPQDQRLAILGAVVALELIRERTPRRVGLI